MMEPPVAQVKRTRKPNRKFQDGADSSNVMDVHCAPTARKRRGASSSSSSTSKQSRRAGAGNTIPHAPANFTELQAVVEAGMLNLPPLLRDVDPRVIDRELAEVVATEPCVMEFRAPNGYLSIEGHRQAPGQQGHQAQVRLRQTTFVKRCEKEFMRLFPGVRISSLWVTVRKPKDSITGVASGLQDLHGDTRVNDQCAAFTFCAAGGTATASPIQYKSGDPALSELLTVESLHGGVRVYTPKLHFSKDKQPPVPHQVPANEAAYAVVTVLIEGGGGAPSTPDDLLNIAAAARELPLPPAQPTLTPTEYAGLCCISKQVDGSLLRGHRTTAERSLKGKVVAARSRSFAEADVAQLYCGLWNDAAAVQGRRVTFKLDYLNVTAKFTEGASAIDKQWAHGLVTTCTASKSTHSSEAGKEAYSSWEDVAVDRNFSANDAFSSGFSLDDFPDVSSQEVLESAHDNRGRVKYLEQQQKAEMSDNAAKAKLLLARLGL